MQVFNEFNKIKNFKEDETLQERSIKIIKYWIKFYLNKFFKIIMKKI